MATPTPTPRVLPVDIPTTPYKEEDETDAQIFRLVAERLDRSVTAPHHMKTTAVQLLRNAAAALEESGAPDPESSYFKPKKAASAAPITFEWTDNSGVVQGHLVYVLYGEETIDRPLYVGKTVDLIGRFVAHRSGASRKEWFGDVRRVVITPCATKSAATRTELELIHSLDPVFNVQRFKVS